MRLRFALIVPFDAEMTRISSSALAIIRVFNICSFCIQRFFIWLSTPMFPFVAAIVCGTVFHGYCCIVCRCPCCSSRNYFCCRSSLRTLSVSSASSALRPKLDSLLKSKAPPAPALTNPSLPSLF